MAMSTFTGFQYLLLDASAHFGLDKETFEDRLDWAQQNLTILEALEDQADNKPQYYKSVLAIRKAQKHQPTGHLVGMDATASGLQIMCAAIGCLTGAKLVNLTDPALRYDAYTEGVHGMNQFLPLAKHILLDGSSYLTRAEVKDGIMTHFYGSRKRPELHFGVDTEELSAFYSMLHNLFPGADMLRQVLLDSWQPYVLEHNWVLDDGFHVHVPVTFKQDVRVELDELAGTSFTHRLVLNGGSKTGLSIAANVIHSIDGMLVREMARRCYHNPADLEYKARLIDSVIANQSRPKLRNCDEFLSLRWISEATGNKIDKWTINELYRAKDLIEDVCSYRPFPVLMVHDEFKAHANHCNRMRYWYKELLAEVAESTLMERLLRQIRRAPGGKLTKMSTQLPDLIRQSNYALC